MVSSLEDGDGDVVVLTPGLGGFGDLDGGLEAEGLGSVEAEEFVFGVGGFDDAVGDEGEGLVGGKMGFGVGVFGFAVDAEGEAGFERQFLAI